LRDGGLTVLSTDEAKSYDDGCGNSAYCIGCGTKDAVTDHFMCNYIDGLEAAIAASTAAGASPRYYASDGVTSTPTPLMSTTSVV
jgi:hypothetical protein